MLESLARVSRTINSALNLDEVLQTITREACGLMRAKLGSLMMLDESGAWLDLRASFGAGPAYIGKPRLGVEESLLGVAVPKDGRAVPTLEDFRAYQEQKHLGSGTP